MKLKIKKLISFNFTCLVHWIIIYL